MLFQGSDMDKAKNTVLFAFAIVVLLILAYVLRHPLLLIYVSCIFAIVLSSAVQGTMKLRIGKWRPNRGVAILLILAGVLAGFTILFLFGLPPVISDLQQLFARFPQELNALRNHVRSVPFLNQIDSSRIQQYAAAVLAAIPQILGSIAGLIAAIAGIAILTAYLILEGEQVFAWSLSLFSPEQSSRLKPVLITAAERMRKWLIGQALLMLILGLSSITVFGLLGVRYFYLLGVFAGLANFIPLLGPVVTVILAGLIAALDSWGKLIGVLIFFFVYQQIENAILTPKIMKATVELPASAVLIALLIGAELAGVAGAMMAVPTAVLGSVLIDAFVIRKNTGTPKN